MFRRPLLTAAAVAALSLFFLDMDHGPDSPLYQLYGLAHVAFFTAAAGVLAGLPLLKKRSFFQQVLLTMAVVCITGGVIELIQPHFGRSASWRDMAYNMLGGGLGLLFFAPARHELGRWFLAGSQILVLSLAGLMFYGPAVTIWDMRQAARQFPMLGDFETRLEKGRWSRGEIDHAFSRHGRASLRVSLEAGGKYAGTTLRRGFGDWTGHTYFAFSIHNPLPDPLFLTVSIRDHEHFRRGGEYEDRFNRRFTMGQGWNDIRIPVQDIENAPAERLLELDGLSEVVFFTVGLSESRVIHVDHVRLIP